MYIYIILLIVSLYFEMIEQTIFYTNYCTKMYFKPGYFKRCFKQYFKVSQISSPLANFISERGRGYKTTPASSILCFS